jgi:hypothetical protein
MTPAQALAQAKEIAAQVDAQAKAVLSPDQYVRHNAWDRLGEVITRLGDFKAGFSKLTLQPGHVPRTPSLTAGIDEVIRQIEAIRFDLFVEGEHNNVVIRK